eukprot:5227433-Pyramimonas_sp.AAC.1
MLAPGQVAKLAGGLSWGATHMFHRLGRAMLRPLFKQSHAYSARCSPDVDAALEWWGDVLRLNLAQTRGFAQAPAAPAWLFVDARGRWARA